MTARADATLDLVALARSLRAATRRVEASGSVIEITGTGGDGLKTINISTVAALVAAAAGVQVAKQNRPAISSDCGSTDLLRELGVAYDLPPEAAAECLRETGICFLYSPIYHEGVFQSASDGVSDPGGRVRSQTMAELLVPISNPAGAQHYVVGVADAELAAGMAKVLRDLGTAHSLVIHGDDGMDEITCTKTTTVHEVRGGEVRTWTLDPTAYGYLRAPRHAILGGDAVENALITRAFLTGKGSLYRQYIEMNAAAALYAADRTSTIEDGVALAKETIDSGAVARTLEHVVAVSQKLKTIPVAL